MYIKAPKATSSYLLHIFGRRKRRNVSPKKKRLTTEEKSHQKRNWPGSIHNTPPSQSGLKCREKNTYNLAAATSILPPPPLPWPPLPRHYTTHASAAAPPRSLVISAHATPRASPLLGLPPFQKRKPIQPLHESGAHFTRLFHLRESAGVDAHPRHLQQSSTKRRTEGGRRRREEGGGGRREEGRWNRGIRGDVLVIAGLVDKSKFKNSSPVS